MDTTRREQRIIRQRLSLQLRRFVKGRGLVLDFSSKNELVRHIKLSRSDFRDYLEYQFLEEMTWGNYCKEWEIDQIVPTSLFDLTKEADLLLCWNFSNMMPMWRKDNEAKANSIEFAKLEIMRRVEAAPSSIILRELLERVSAEEARVNQYTYPLDFLRFYTKVNYIVH